MSGDAARTFDRKRKLPSLHREGDDVVRVELERGGASAPPRPDMRALDTAGLMGLLAVSDWTPPPTCAPSGVSPELSLVADLDRDGYSDLQTTGFLGVSTWHGGPLGLHRDGCPAP